MNEKAHPPTPCGRHNPDAASRAEMRLGKVAFQERKRRKSWKDRTSPHVSSGIFGNRTLKLPPALRQDASTAFRAQPPAGRVSCLHQSEAGLNRRKDCRIEDKAGPVCAPSTRNRWRPRRWFPLLCVVLGLGLFSASCDDSPRKHPSDILDSDSDDFGTISDPGLRDYGVGRAHEPGPITLLPVPRALSATPDAGGIGLTWWDVDGAEAYAVYRGTAIGSTPEQAERHVVQELQWRDTAVRPGEFRAYAVAAIIDGVEGPLSGEVHSRGVLPEPQRQLRITMRPQDADELFRRNAYNDTLLPAEATVLPDLEPTEVVGLRFRGAGSRRYPKFGMNIRLENRPHWNFGTEFRRGSDRILTNAMWTDPSAMRDVIGLVAYREVGIPAPDTQYVEFYLNDIFEGFYVLFERIDREALQGWNLNRRRGGMSLVRDDMKSARRRLDLEDHRSTFGLDLDEMFDTDDERIAFLQSVWDARGEIEDHDWNALLDLVRWVYQTPPGPAFEQGFNTLFRAEEVHTLLALHAIFMDTDSLDSDFWLYRDEDGDGLWRLIPWDKNLIFGNGWYGDWLGGNSFFRYDRVRIYPLTNMLFEKYLETPALNRALDQRIRELLDSTFSRAWFDAHAERLLPRILDGMARRPGPDAYHRQPQQHHAEDGYLAMHIEQLSEFMDLRRAWLILDIERRAGNVYGEPDRAMRERFGIRQHQRRCLTEQRGNTLACLTPRAGDWTGSASVAPIVDNDIDGVHRRYIVQVTQRFQGDLTLHYYNAPGRNWLAREEWDGDQWRLDMVHTTPSADTRQLRTRVNPYANLVVGHVDLEPGVHTFTLQLGPVPEHRVSTAGDEDEDSSALAEDAD